jgi:hypothetical protein
MDRTAQRVCIWSGPVMCVVWLAGFLLAHYIPPPHPTDSAQLIQRTFEDHTLRIRLGLLMTMFASALLVPFGAVISAQMRRIEGPHQVLATTQIASCAVLSLEFIVPVMVWLTAAYRPSVISAQMLRMLDDMGWLMFVAVISSVMVQVAAIAFAIFLDKREKPIFPRWAGYLNAWIVLLLSPTALVVFFKRGPFSWDGAISFFLPLTVYCVWIISMTVLLRRAMNAQADDAEIPPVAAVRFDAGDAQQSPLPPIKLLSRCSRRNSQLRMKTHGVVAGRFVDIDIETTLVGVLGGALAIIRAMLAGTLTSDAATAFTRPSSGASVSLRTTPELSLGDRSRRSTRPLNGHDLSRSSRALQVVPGIAHVTWLCRRRVPRLAVPRTVGSVAELRELATVHR